MSIADARKKIDKDLRPIADESKDVRAETKRQERAQSSYGGKTIAGQKGRPRYLFPSEGASGHLNVDTLRWGDISPKIPRSDARTLLQVMGCPFEVRCRISHHAHQTKLGKSYDKLLYSEEAKHWWQVLGSRLAELDPDVDPVDNVVPMRKKRV